MNQTNRSQTDPHHAGFTRHSASLEATPESKRSYRLCQAVMPRSGNCSTVLARRAAGRDFRIAGHQSQRSARIKSAANIVCMLAVAAVQTVQGVRPAQCLQKWLTERDYQQLVHQARRASVDRMVSGERRCGVHLIRCRMQCPASGVVEASVTVRQSTRVRCVAVRLEWCGSTWITTGLSVL